MGGRGGLGEGAQEGSRRPNLSYSSRDPEGKVGLSGGACQVGLPGDDVAQNIKHDQI